MINRRNFIKVVTGFVGGVFAAFMPKAKGLTLADVEKAKELCESDKALLKHTEKAVDPPKVIVGIVERSETYIGKDGKRRYWSWIHPLVDPPMTATGVRERWAERGMTYPLEKSVDPREEKSK